MNAAAPSGATTPATIVADTTSAAAQTTAVTDCHLHGTATYVGVFVI